MNEQPRRTAFFGGCPHDCPDTCAMIYEVEDGRLVEVRGNKEHPMTRGGLCVKLKDYHDHHYNPNRVLYPLRRVGPKASRQLMRQSPRSFRAGRTSSRATAARRSCLTPISGMRG
jgi:anaerobic selenocysteine-containing dehydrogenase